jgi:hypothetical protein
VLVVTSLGVLAASIVLFEEASGHQLAVLVPCAATIGIIKYGNVPYVRLMLVNPAIVNLGVVSYSTYLWHWPLIVLYKYWKLSQYLNNVERASLLLLSVLAGSVSYHHVEQKYRVRAENMSVSESRSVRVVILIATAALVMFATGLLFSTVSLKQPLRLPYGRTPSVDDVSADLLGMRNSACRLEWLDNQDRCFMNRSVQILVFGNSHEDAGYWTISKLYGSHPDVNIIRFGGTNRCEFHFPTGRPQSSIDNWDCRRRTTMATDPAFVRGLKVVIVSSLGFLAPDLDKHQFLNYMRAVNPSLKLIVLGDYIRMKVPCTEVLTRYQTSDACRWKRYVEVYPFDARRNSTARALDPYLYVDKGQILCRAGLSTCLVEGGGDVFSYDGNHMTNQFARFLGTRLWNFYSGDLLLYGLPQPIRADNFTA